MNLWCRLFGHRWEMHGSWHTAGPICICLRRGCTAVHSGWPAR